MHPSIISILLGRHGYSMDPETETAWCRFCLILGFIAGSFFVLWCMGH